MLGVDSNYSVCFLSLCVPSLMIQCQQFPIQINFKRIQDPYTLMSLLKLWSSDIACVYLKKCCLFMCQLLVVSVSVCNLFSTTLFSEIWPQSTALVMYVRCNVAPIISCCLSRIQTLGQVCSGFQAQQLGKLVQRVASSGLSLFFLMRALKSPSHDIHPHVALFNGSSLSKCLLWCF